MTNGVLTNGWNRPEEGLTLGVYLRCRCCSSGIGPTEAPEGGEGDLAHCGIQDQQLTNNVINQLSCEVKRNERKQQPMFIPLLWVI